MDTHLLNGKSTEDLFADTEYTWDLTEDSEAELSGEKFNYHFIFGNEKIVFIKAGAGGSSRGYKDKYIKMAERIHERIGATVICASNPIDPICDAPDAEEIRWAVNKMGLASFELYLLGVSDGAYLNLNLASQFPETVKWIGINASFVEISDLEEKLKTLPNVFKLMIYGTRDDNFNEVVPELSEMSCDNFTLKFVEGADHSFKDMLEEFVSLSDFV